MKLDNLFLIVLLLVVVCSTSKIKEAYENIYQKNDIRAEEPDDTQFYACNNEKFKDFGNSDYHVRKNAVREPMKGTFSAFLDLNKIRTYDHFYHAPICEDTYPFDTEFTSQFRLIPGAFPEENISRILTTEKEKDAHDLYNPYYFYGHPDYIQNKILYNDTIQDMFLKVKGELKPRNEDNSHLKGIDSRYHGKIHP
tara:strand:- start:70 stop:657 length:588 start_codon:yes stop_codon:yes gene_type:complete